MIYDKTIILKSLPRTCLLITNLNGFDPGRAVIAEKRSFNVVIWLELRLVIASVQKNVVFFTRAGEPVNFLAAPAPARCFFFKRLRLLGFFYKRLRLLFF